MLTKDGGHTDGLSGGLPPTTHCRRRGIGKPPGRPCHYGFLSCLTSEAPRTLHPCSGDHSHGVLLCNQATFAALGGNVDISPQLVGSWGQCAVLLLAWSI